MRIARLVSSLPLIITLFTTASPLPAAGQTASNYPLIIDSHPSLTVVAPGQRIAMTVHATNGLDYQGVILASNLFGGFSDPQTGAGPFTFNFTVPDDFPRGVTAITAVGRTSALPDPVSSYPNYALDIEDADAGKIANLVVSPTELTLPYVGAENYLSSCPERPISADLGGTGDLKNAHLQ